VIVYRAAWVLPIAAPPIRAGWVAVDGGLLVDVGRGPRSDATDLGDVALLPALVNAHTHLELSHLAGAVPPSTRFVPWARQVIAARRRVADPADPLIVEAARRAIDHLAETGTGLVGDVSNTLVTVPLLRDAGMSARVFHELLGFSAEDPAGLVSPCPAPARRPTPRRPAAAGCG
jgi:cytosine/adenosine deaminase-related metal-dependent hydrolase